MRRPILLLSTLFIVTMFYSCEEPNEETTGTVTDIDGNVYKTVKIGDQWWMAENLKVTKYRDGTAIPNVTDNISWAELSNGAWCYYNNDIDNAETYGALYNWYAVADSRGLAPEGWHVPTDAEWTELENYLGGSSVAGNKLKSTSGWYNEGNGTDEVGLAVFAGGYRYGSDGYFNGISSSATFWSASENGAYFSWGRYLDYSHSTISRSGIYIKQDGFSVRCVRDVE